MSVEDLPDLDMPALLQQYLKAQPKDPATVDNLLTAVHTAYPEVVGVVTTELVHAPVKSQSISSQVRDSPLLPQRSSELRRFAAEATTSGGGGGTDISPGLRSQQDNPQSIGLHGEDLGTTAEKGQPSGQLTDFVSAWQNFNKGGALADFYKMRPRPQQVQRRVSKRGLHVLDWGFGV